LLDTAAVAMKVRTLGTRITCIWSALTNKFESSQIWLTNRPFSHHRHCYYETRQELVSRIICRWSIIMYVCIVHSQVEYG